MNTISILETLVSFDTTSGRSNRDLVDWVHAYLASHGVTAKRMPNSDGSKFNLLATIGPGGSDGIVLSGHTDIVPVEGQDWATSPFRLTERDDRLYGRGTCDMKGFLSSVLAAVPAMKAANLARPVHLAFSYDEEVGALGVPELARAIGPAAAAIIGEPTGMKIADRHKGSRVETVTFTGVAAHSSMPQLGVSAIEFAARFILSITDLNSEFERRRPGGDTDPIHVSTLNAGTIQGGSASNIVPSSCTVEWQLRCAPDQNAEEISDRIHGILTALEADMKQQDPACTITSDLAYNVPPLRPDAACFARETCQQITGENAAMAVNFGTEAGFFKREGIPSVVCGPGSIEQAHKPNEFITTKELRKCDAFLAALLRRISD